jgi:threonine/homoserine/homoserine lactone efflux protein
MLGTVISAVIVGLGGAFMLWLRWKQAAADKAKADSLESAAKGEVEASKTEGVLLDERDSDNAKPKDIGDIRS